MKTRFLVLLSLASALTACVGRREAAIGSPQEPLVLLLSPAHAPSSQEPLRFLERELSSRSGLSVVVNVAASPKDSIEQFGLRQADAGILTLEEFLLAREEYEVRPGLQVLREGSQTEYDCVILVKAKDRAEDVHALSGKKFGFVDPYSVSGFILPEQHLKISAVQVEPVFTGGHDQALAALLKGEVSAIATYADSGRRGVRVLAKTGTVPNEPVAFRRGLKSEKQKALADALLGLAGTPEGKKALWALAHIAGLGTVNDGSYRSAHELLQAAGKSVYDIVPEGKEIQRLNQPYVDLR